jgi:hypothetical protein
VAGHAVGGAGEVFAALDLIVGMGKNTGAARPTARARRVKTRFMLNPP